MIPEVCQAEGIPTILNDALMEYIGACTARGAASENTKAAYQAGILVLLAWCRERGHDVRDMGRNLVEQWRGDMMQAGASPATVMQRLAAARTLFKAMQRAGVRSDNPAEYVKSPRPEETTIERVMRKIVLPDQMAAVLAGLGVDYRAIRDRALLMAMYVLGLRVSEVVGLDWEHLEGETLTFVAKGRQTRSLTVPKGLKEAFDRLKAADGATGGPIFQVNGARISVRGVQKMVARRMALVGRSGYNAHAFRHCCASVAAISGANPYAIQDQLGHASQRTTSIYTRVAGRYHDAPSMVISKAMGF